MIAWLKECGSNFRLTSRIHVIPNGCMGRKYEGAKLRCRKESMRSLTTAWEKINGLKCQLVDIIA